MGQGLGRRLGWNTKAKGDGAYVVGLGLENWDVQPKFDIKEKIKNG